MFTSYPQTWAENDFSTKCTLSNYKVNLRHQMQTGTQFELELFIYFTIIQLLT